MSLPPGIPVVSSVIGFSGTGFPSRQSFNAGFGLHAPSVGASAPGYPEKRLTKLRFSWTSTITC